MFWGWIPKAESTDIIRDDMVIVDPYKLIFNNVLSEVLKYTDPVEANQRLARYRLNFEIIKFESDDLDTVSSCDINCHKDPRDQLLDEIINFDKNELEEIRECKIKTDDFILSIKNTLEFIIVDNRIKSLGKDPQFSYTYEEYQRAYRYLLRNEVETKFSQIRRINICLFAISLTLLTLPSSDKTSGMFFGILISSGITYCYWIKNYLQI